MGKILAVDFGTKNVGLAISDELGITARILPAIRNYNTNQVIKSLIKLCTENDVKTILFGTPLDPQGKDTELSTLIKKAGNKIGESDLKIIYWDEYLSSKQASEYNKKNIDSESAKILLLEFLNSKESLDHFKQ